MKIAIVIPNWNGRKFIGDCLRSLEKQTVRSEIIVVDNGSTDGSAKYIKSNFPGVRVVELDENRGFAGGVNVGIEAAMVEEFDYVALCNNDAVFDKNWLKHLVAVLDNRNDVAIATGKLLRKDGLIIDSTGEFIDAYGMPHPRSRDKKDGQHLNVADYVFGATGGASLYRVSLFEQIGLFDEDFFAYFEDVDMSFRAQLAGFKVFYEPQATARHDVGRTSKKLGDFARYQSIKNYILLYNKNMPGKLYWRYKPKFFWQLTRIFVGCVRDGKPMTYVRASSWALVRIPKTLAKRYRIQRDKKIDDQRIRHFITHQRDPEGRKLIVIDARESGTSTGRYVDKLIENLHKQNQDYIFKLLAKDHRVEYLKSIAPSFEIIPANVREFTFGEQLDLKKIVKQQKADLVHFPAVQQPVFYKGNVVTTMQDLTTVRFRNPAKNWLVFTIKQQIYKWVNKRVARKSVRVITPTEFVREDVARYCDIPRSKITATLEAGDVIPDKPKPIAKLKNKRFILFVGRPAANKNLNRLVDAFEILQEKDPGLWLVFTGKLNSEYEKLRQYSKGKSSQVLFTDFASEAELKWLYQNTAVYAFPSLSEGFGLPPLEAMINGKAPVVSSNATCLPEVLQDAALYFDPLDVQDMADKIGRVLSNKALSKSLGEKGYKLAQTYSWERMAKQTMEVYKKALR